MVNVKVPGIYNSGILFFVVLCRCAKTIDSGKKQLKKNFIEKLKGEINNENSSRNYPDSILVSCVRNS